MAERAGAWRNWATLPLTTLAGCVDSIGYLRLDELFVSFMSGTTTLLGLALTAGRADRAAVLGTVVGLFAAGALAGSALGSAVGKAWRAPAVLALVAGLLAAAWRLPLDAAAPRADLAVVPAMGALNAAVTGVGGITFVTGSLTRFANALVAALARAGPPFAWAPQIATWAALLAGAVGGGTLEARLGQHAVGVSAAAAAALAALAALAAAGSARRRRP